MKSDHYIFQDLYELSLEKHGMIDYKLHLILT